VKRSFTVIATITLLIATIITGSACNQNKEGELPIVHTGDKWVYKAMDGDGNEYTYTVEVTGDTIDNGRDCYVVECSYIPPWQESTDNEITEIEKATFLAIKIKRTGTNSMSEPFTSTTIRSFEHPEDFPWPLEVDKEVKQVETSITIMGEELTGTEPEAIPVTTIIKIETIEDITVSAGTFRCFKIVGYYEGQKQYIKWYSDKVKQYVKATYEDTGSSLELQSYTLV